MEIRYPLQTMPIGRRREQTLRELEVVLREEIEERYVPFDLPAAQQAADLITARRLRGRIGEIRPIIAGIVPSRNASLAHEEYSTLPGSRCSPD